MLAPWSAAKWYWMSRNSAGKGGGGGRASEAVPPGTASQTPVRALSAPAAAVGAEAGAEAVLVSLDGLEEPPAPLSLSDEVELTEGGFRYWGARTPHTFVPDSSANTSTKARTGGMVQPSAAATRGFAASQLRPTSARLLGALSNALKAGSARTAS